MELQREKGGDPDVDVSYQYLQFFLENDEVSSGDPPHQTTCSPCR